MLRFAMKEAIKGMIRNPTLIWNRELVPRYPLVVKNILKKVFPSIIKKNPLTAAHTFSSKLGLVVIGVHPSYRGTGCFEMLMQRFEEECKKRQVAEITLTVKASNDRAVAAYKKYGWQVSREARGSLEMFKTVDAAK
jgi:ribosomal protein S18 acetylase RimI-like enzyme